MDILTRLRLPHASLSKPPKVAGSRLRVTESICGLHEVSKAQEHESEQRRQGGDGPYLFAERKPMQWPAASSSDKGAHEEVSGNHSR